MLPLIPLPLGIKTKASGRGAYETEKEESGQAHIRIDNFYSKDIPICTSGNSG